MKQNKLFSEVIWKKEKYIHVKCSVTCNKKEKGQQMSKIGLYCAQNNSPKDVNLLTPKPVIIVSYMVKGTLQVRFNQEFWN